MVAITAKEAMEFKMMLEAPNVQILINPAEAEAEDLDLEPRNIVRRNIILLTILHLSLVYSFYSSFIQRRLKTFL
jgi:hypothetical protein